MRNFNHPGKFINETYLNVEGGIDVKAAAKRLGIDINTVHALINGKLYVGDTLARKISIAFGKSAQSWLDMQRIYDENNNG